MSRKRKVILIVVALIVILCAAIAAVITVAERNLKAMETITIENFDLTQVPDGTFTGDYNAFPVIVRAEVTVRDHVITAIELIKHMNGRGGAAEVIPDRVVQAQTLLVDSISGATYSSKVILLAIYNALENAVGD